MHLSLSWTGNKLRQLPERATKQLRRIPRQQLEKQLGIFIFYFFLHLSTSTTEGILWKRRHQDQFRIQVSIGDTLHRGDGNRSCSSAGIKTVTLETSGGMRSCTDLTENVGAFFTKLRFLFIVRCQKGRRRSDLSRFSETVEKLSMGLHRLF